ncbi:MAG: hypothetical protein WC415_02560 [Patescibacteria group bacterium]|jgi:hypothetical protein
MKNKIIIGLLSVVLTISLCSIAFAQEAPDPNFNPGNIISNAEILDYNSMTEAEIQKFLEDKNSYLANYSVADPNTNEMMRVSKIIYTRCQENKISPKFVLVLLQKEQGLIEDANPSSGSLDWATGYGCPDGGGCNSRWQGIWKQINSATLQFFDYLESPQDYSFQAGKTYSFTNPYSTTIKGDLTITIENGATAGLYNYTPHVYNGNYNFWKLWRRYFTRTYPNGSLLQANGEAGVWLIKKGQKRPFIAKSALTSRFDQKKIIQVDKSVLDGYPTGAPIKFPNYSLIKSPRGTIFLLVDDKKRGFTSSDVFKTFGYNPEEVMNASWEDINSYVDGVPLSATSTYPTGALLQDKTTGGVFWIEEGIKYPLHDKSLLTYKFAKKKIIPVLPKDLDLYPTGTPILFSDGELLTSPSTKAVYLVENGMKRPFVSGQVFEKFGYKWENIISVSPQFLAKYPNGEVIDKKSF